MPYKCVCDELSAGNKYSFRTEYPTGRVWEISQAIKRSQSGFLAIICAHGNHITYSNPFAHGMIQLDEWLDDLSSLTLQDAEYLISNILRAIVSISPISHGNIYLRNIFIEINQSQLHAYIGPFNTIVNEESDSKAFGYIVLAILGKTEGPCTTLEKLAECLICGKVLSEVATHFLLFRPQTRPFIHKDLVDVCYEIVEAVAESSIILTMSDEVPECEVNTSSDENTDDEEWKVGTKSIIGSVVNYFISKLV